MQSGLFSRCLPAVRLRVCPEHSFMLPGRVTMISAIVIAFVAEQDLFLRRVA